MDWAQALAANAGERDEVATDMLLHAVRSVAEPANYRILCRLNQAGESSVEELMEVAGLGRLPVLERVNHLLQAGLVSRAIESGKVSPTRLTSGLIGFLERVQGRLCEKIEERLPKLLEGGK